MRSGYFKVDYRRDRELFPLFIERLVLAVAVVAAIILPLITDRYLLHLTNLTMIAIVGAIGLNLLMGYTGQVSLGHAAFLAIGGYTTAIVAGYLPQLPFPVVILIAGAVTSVTGLLAAVPAFRLKGLYLALSTLAFYYIVMFIILKAEPLTGGAMGRHIPELNFFGLELDGEYAFYPVGLAIVVLGLVLAKNLLRTKTGRAWKAIRDWDLAAEAMGVNLRMYKTLSFTTGAFYAGVAGSLYAYYIGFISPQDFTFTVSVNYIAMVIVGGMGTLAGTVAGAAFITMLPNWINQLAGYLQSLWPAFQASTAVPYLERLFFGLAIVLFLIFEPEGLFGLWKSLRNYLVMWPFRY
ncbi:MAG: branched-chain amino acid ABC transporter permease [Clostridia bacterium]|nr:MAG: branched-chain amino acid ABC transporter permease [Clostridia bacterium]